MGHGIAQVFAQAGLEVFLHDVETSALDEATSSIARSLDKTGYKGKGDRPGCGARAASSDHHHRTRRTLWRRLRR